MVIPSPSSGATSCPTNSNLLCFVVARLSAGLAAIERGIMMREGVIYVNPSTDSAKLSNIGRGREVAVLERTPGWVNVVGTVAISPDPDNESDRNVTGWMIDKGVITPATPDGDKIIYGEAFDCEQEASHRGGRPGADSDAMRLYARTGRVLPAVAPGSRGRLSRCRHSLADRGSRRRVAPFGKDAAIPQLHHQIDEDYMRKVVKKYPGTKWADLAAYHLLDNKLCGDWEAEAKCPEIEGAMYIKYADEHPQSPKAPEALYKAAWRYSTLITIYKTNNDQKKADEASQRSLTHRQEASCAIPQRR